MERAQQERLRLVNGAAPQVHLRHRTGARFISLTPDFPVPPPRGDPFSEQTCSRRRSIAATAPVSLADTAKAGVYVQPLPDGSAAILRESPQQRLRRLKRLREIYTQRSPEEFNKVVCEEAERLEEETKVFFALVSARVRRYLRRKQLLAIARLSLTGFGNLGIKPKGQSTHDEYVGKVMLFETLNQSISRAPPSGKALKLCQSLSFTPSDVWLGFACPRAVRAPTFPAARLGGSGVMTSNCSAV